MSPRQKRLAHRRYLVTLPDGLESAWHDASLTLSDICVEFGLCLAELRKLAKLHELPQRPEQSMQVKTQRKRLPTTDEIAAQCAKIRAGWSESIRESRWMGKRAVPYQTPEIPIQDITLG